MHQPAVAVGQSRCHRTVRWLTKNRIGSQSWNTQGQLYERLAVLWRGAQHRPKSVLPPAGRDRERSRPDPPMGIRWICRLAGSTLGAAVSIALLACGGCSSAPSANAPKQLSPETEPGERIFRDASLSASGAMSCETCHSPSNAHAQPTPLAVPLGGLGLNVPGFRNAPSLHYLSQTPPFFFDSEGTPTGGFNRDGRAQSLME